MKIQIAGYKGKGTGGAFIKRFTFGKYSHVSLVFTHDDGYVEEIESIQGEGVHSKIFSMDENPDMFYVPCTKKQAHDVYREATRLVGCKYDWAGIWGFVTRKKKENPDKWFCSELVAHCLKEADIVLHNLPAWKQSPVLTCASVRIVRVLSLVALLCAGSAFGSVNTITDGSSFSTWRTQINEVIGQSNTNVTDITATSNAFVAADAQLAVDYAAADTVVSNGVIDYIVAEGFTTETYVDAQDVIVSNALVSGYTAADTSLETTLTSAYQAADTAVSNGVTADLTAAFIAADTVLSNALIGEILGGGATTNYVDTQDTVVSNAFVAADTALDASLTADYIAADTVVSNGVTSDLTASLTAAYTAADTALSNSLSGATSITYPVSPYGLLYAYTFDDVAYTNDWWGGDVLDNVYADTIYHKFDSTIGGYIQEGTSTLLEGEAFSINNEDFTVFVTTKSPTSSGSQSYKTTVGSSSGISIELSRWSTGPYLRAYMRDGSTTLFERIRLDEYETWGTMCYTYDSSTTNSIVYFNGSQQGAVNTGDVLDFSSQKLKVFGLYTDQIGDNEISSCYVWNRTLSSNEVARVHSLELNGQYGVQGIRKP